MQAVRKASILTAIVISFPLIMGQGTVMAEGAHDNPNNLTPKERLAEQDVMAQAWFQTSGEANALYHQAFNHGKEKLDEALEKETNQDPAVVLDIDETVLDGSPFDALNFKHGDDTSLNEWQKSAAAEALPGSLDFLDYADKKGVDIYYITGRSSELKDATVENMQNIDAPQANDEHVLLLDNNTTKQDRFNEVDNNHSIVLFFGDNLSDFSGFPKNQPLEARNKQVNEEQDKFGDKFILLPNPTYGDWEKALYTNDNMTAKDKIQARENHLTYYNPEDNVPNNATPKEKLFQEQNTTSIAWYQTAGEAKALYHQGYNLGKEKLDEALEEEHQDPAIILDLDETVLNGGPYNALMTKTGGQASLDKWQKSAQAEALPGALDFLDYADKKGVQIYYVTGRSDKLQDATEENLEKIGVPQMNSDHVLLTEEDEYGKQDRFDTIERDHDVLLYFGDNLADFSGFPKHQGLDARNRQVSDEADQFGDRFIVFPNPMYGDWENALYEDGEETAQEKMDARKHHLTYFEADNDENEISFPDVTQSDVHYDAIMHLASKGIINGKKDGRFHSWGDTSRGQMADMLTKAQNLHTPDNIEAVLNQYDDVNASSFYAEEIAAVTKAGIFEGRNDHFNSFDHLTRAQMASVLTSAFDLGDIDNDKKVDISLENVSQPHQNAVQIIANLGITNAVDNYDGHKTVKRAQAAAFIDRSLTQE